MEAATGRLIWGAEHCLFLSMTSTQGILRKHSPLLIATIVIGINKVKVLGKINDVRILIEAFIVPIEGALKELFIGANLKLLIDHLDVAKKLILKATISFRLMF
jgi:hypothetical protein